MIRFGLRLALSSGREAAVRLVVIAAAVALGSALLLSTLAGLNAVDAQNSRYAWLNTGLRSAAAPVAGTPAPDPLWWLIRGDYFDRRTIARVDVAATGPHAPVPPGIPALPGPGEFYASPALSALLASTPGAELGDRFPGRQIGTIGAPALPSPDSLIIVIGRPVGELSQLPGAQQVTAVNSTPPGDCDGCVVGFDAAALDLILTVVAGALVFPLLMFIGTATRLAAARREQRFAAMRLVGATPGQISTISAVESAIAAVTGVVAGFVGYLLLRPVLVTLPFTGAPFAPGDLSLGITDVLLVAVGVPVAAAVAAQVALRRVRISPLGVTRRVTPRPPRAYRLIPLVVGIAELAYFIGRRPATTDGQSVAFLSGVLLTMVGLVAAGPWLTMVGSRLLARRTQRPSTLVAARRLADNPRAAFRAVSGLVLALFVTTVAIGVMTTIVANRGGPQSSRMAGDTMALTLWGDQADLNQPSATTPPGPDGVPTGMQGIPGVRSVTVTRAAPAGATSSGGTVEHPFAMPALLSCADLSRTPAFGRCEAGAGVAAVTPDLLAWGATTTPSTVWPTASVSLDVLRQLPVLSIVVDTDGSTSAIERVRTAFELAYPRHRFPATDADFHADTSRTLAGWQQLANVVVLASIAIAGCSLAVSVAGGLSERKRPFSLLRLTGVPLGVLRRVITLESAVPLLAAAVVAIGAGLLAAHLFLRAQMDYSLRPPGATYYISVAAGLLASLAIIAATLPLLRRITGPETARNE